MKDVCSTYSFSGFSSLTVICVQDKKPPRRTANTKVAVALSWMRSQIRGVPAPVLIWTLTACSATLCLLLGLRTKRTDRPRDPPVGAAVRARAQRETAPERTSETLRKSEEEAEEDGEDAEDGEDEVEECEGEEGHNVTDNDEEEEEKDKQDE